MSQLELLDQPPANDATALTPWQFTSRKLCSWLLPHLQYDLEEISEPCSCCGAPPASWPTPEKAVLDKDGYGMDLVLCEDCIPLYNSTVEHMGVERLTGSKSEVPNKFGMWASVSVIADQNGATLYMPQKIFDKLPPGFPVKTVVWESKKQATELMTNADVAWPAVVISDLGKKKPEMVNSLVYSYGSTEVAWCSADETSLFNQEALLKIIELVKPLAKKERTAISKALTQSAGGLVSPAGLYDLAMSNENLLKVLQLESDPIARKFIARCINGL